MALQILELHLMPAYCSLCASDDYTSERETDDGRVFAVCSARYHGTEPYVWEPTPTLSRNTRGDGLGSELGIWDKLLECVPAGGPHSYGIVEGRLFELYPNEAAGLQERYGHRWRDGRKSQSRFSMSVVPGRTSQRTRRRGLLAKSFAPADGPWAYNGIISHWKRA